MIRFPLHRPIFRVRPLYLLTAMMLIAAACRKREIRTYTAPKDHVEGERPVNSELGTGLPSLTWSLPAGWKELGADQMSAARFSTAGDASVMVTPLPLMAGQEASLVNMWRQMMEQPLLDPGDAAKALREVDLAGGKGNL